MSSRRTSISNALAQPADARRPWLLLAAVALVTLCALLSAGPAHAGWVIQGLPGATCNVDPSLPDHPWEYRDRRLVNTGEGRWDVVVASCPVSLYAPGVRPVEYRIVMTDAERREAWCQVYRSDGRLLRTEYADWTRGATIWDTLEGVSHTAGLVEVTFRCLLHPGASINRIEIVWFKP